MTLPLREALFPPQLLLIIACAALTGCATSTPSAQWSRQQTDALRQRILQLGSVIDDEALAVAESAVKHPVLLSQQYRAIKPPWLHNHLVNAGARKRGLCYHWANDLFAHLNELALHSLELHLVVARLDTSREHNAVVVTAHGRPFSEGIVLDAWRDSGRLWWGSVATDKYPWELLPYERINPSLRKFVHSDTALHEPSVSKPMN